MGAELQSALTALVYAGTAFVYVKALTTVWALFLN